MDGQSISAFAEIDIVSNSRSAKSRPGCRRPSRLAALAPQGDGNNAGWLMTTLLLAEHDNKSLKDATNKALTVAKALGAEGHILVAGSGCKAVADAAAKLDGVSKVLLADAPAYEHMLA